MSTHKERICPDTWEVELIKKGPKTTPETEAASHEFHLRVLEARKKAGAAGQSEKVQITYAKGVRPHKCRV